MLKPVRCFCDTGKLDMKSAFCVLLLASSLWAGAMNPPVNHLKPDLAEHLVQQLRSRTNNASSRFTGPTDGSNRFLKMPVVAPNFWLRGVTNIFAMSQGRFRGRQLWSSADYIVPISPHICIGAAHTGGGVGSKNLWLLPDGTYYTNEIIASLKPKKSADIILMFMAKTNWTFVKIFPNATNKLAYWLHPDSTNVVPVFVRFHQGIGRTNRYHTSFVSGSRLLGGLYHINGQFEYGDYSKGDRWVGGDSGGAAYAIIHNEAVLVGCAFTGGYAMPIARYQDQINAAMAELCASNHVPVERLTLYDLSGFRTY